MSADFDICIIGSGAGGAPVALSASRAGRSVVVLEKGPWYTERDFFKDEIAECYRQKFRPRKEEQPHVVETKNDDGSWRARPTYKSGWDFWNGSMVGGATNIMSGFFLRMKPIDFRLRSEFGPVDGAEVEDWPISYEQLEPYYALAETEIGISGQAVAHPFAEPRSTPDFPFPPTAEHPIAKWIDQAGLAAGAHPIPLPRAILSRPAAGRRSCSYSWYCGNYGCATGAKGSARAALLNRAIETGRCEIRPHSMARRIVSGSDGKATEVEYFDQDGRLKIVSARTFVVACQPVETSRLLLMSSGPKHPNGLGNNRDQVGRYLLFSATGSAEAAFLYADFTAEKAEELRSQQPFVNRTIQDWYVIDDKKFGPRIKGGSMDFVFVHPNPIGLGRYFAFASAKEMVWGRRFQQELRRYIHDARHIMVEIFADWQPLPDCRVTLDTAENDKWGLPSARVRVGGHPLHGKVSGYLAERAAEVLRAAGGRELETDSSGGPATNLVAGTCRFGTDPSRSVLDPDCRIHDAENVYVTDGSFMPTGGSVPYTWTIYANSFRVADKIVGKS